MTLYSYDHCPYCVKARMIFGLKSVPLDLKTLLNDDEKTPHQLIGQKMLPILVKDDGTAISESLDIIAYVDNLIEYGSPRVQESRQDPQLLKWLQDIRRYHYALAMPRWILMGLEEFATQSAVAYFTFKKEKNIGPFSENLKKTPQLIAIANQHLFELDEIIVGDPFFWGQELTLDDFHVFASLRCLTTTVGVKFPDKINDYMNRLSSLSAVPLHWSLALE